MSSTTNASTTSEVQRSSETTPSTITSSVTFSTTAVLRESYVGHTVAVAVPCTIVLLVVVAVTLWLTRRNRQPGVWISTLNYGIRCTVHNAKTFLSGQQSKVQTVVSRKKNVASLDIETQRCATVNVAQPMEDHIRWSFVSHNKKRKKSGLYSKNLFVKRCCKSRKKVFKIPSYFKTQRAWSDPVLRPSVEEENIYFDMSGSFSAVKSSRKSEPINFASPLPVLPNSYYEEDSDSHTYCNIQFVADIDNSSSSNLTSLSGNDIYCSMRFSRPPLNTEKGFTVARDRQKYCDFNKILHTRSTFRVETKKGSMATGLLSRKSASIRDNRSGMQAQPTTTKTNNTPRKYRSLRKLKSTIRRTKSSMKRWCKKSFTN